jgi:hypothetical protein
MSKFHFNDLRSQVFWFSSNFYVSSRKPHIKNIPNYGYKLYKLFSTNQVYKICYVSLAKLVLKNIVVLKSSASGSTIYGRIGRIGAVKIFAIKLVWSNFVVIIIILYYICIYYLSIFLHEPMWFVKGEQCS